MAANKIKMMDITFRKVVQYALFCVFILIYFYLILEYGQKSISGVLSVSVCLFALYIADALTGIIHFYLDYRPNVKDKGLKDLFFYEGDKGSSEYAELRRNTMARVSAFEEVVYDFKVHHPSPNTLGRRGFVKLTLGGVVFGALPFSLLVLVLFELQLISPTLMLFCLVFITGMVLSQYTHSCAHKDPVPFVPMLLQKTGLFITVKRHEIHHLTLDRDFCTLNGWANPLVNVVFSTIKKQGWLDSEGLVPD